MTVRLENKPRPSLRMSPSHFKYGMFLINMLLVFQTQSRTAGLCPGNVSSLDGQYLITFLCLIRMLTAVTRLGSTEINTQNHFEKCKLVSTCGLEAWP